MSMIGRFAALPTVDMTRIKADPGAVENYLNPDEGEGVPPFHVEIDKAWHAIHFMLSGVAGPRFRRCWAERLSARTWGTVPLESLPRPKFARSPIFSNHSHRRFLRNATGRKQWMRRRSIRRFGSATERRG